MKRWRWLIFLSVTVLLGLAAGIFAAKLAKPFRSEGGSFIDIVQTVQNPRKQFPNQSKFTVLLLGKDYNYTNKGIRYTSKSRTDTIMLLSVNLDTKEIGAVSIPRDTKIRDADGDLGKINAVYTRGGLDLLERTLEEKFGVQVDYSVVLKPDAVKEIVDAVGGVEVEPIDKMNYDDTWARLSIHFEPGRQRITGEQAVGYVRFRETGSHEMDDNGELVRIKGSRRSKEEGDLRRTARQQEVLRALMAEARTPGNIMRADQIIDIGFGQVETNFKRIQLLALAQIFKESLGKMKSATLPGEDQMTDAYYYVLDDERSQMMIDWIIKGDEIAGKQLIRVAVSNGTSTSGAARQASEYIESQLGYDSWFRTASVKAADTTEVLYTKAAYEEAAIKVKELIGAASIRKDPSSDAPYRPEIVVIIGKDIAEKMAALNKSENSDNQESDPRSRE